MASSPLTPPAAERAYDFVKTQILRGVIEDSTMLSEGEIAQSLELSRTPVREAFLRLEVEGYLKLFPKRGAFVVPISLRDIQEVYDARLLIDSHAAKFICGLDDFKRKTIQTDLQDVVDQQWAALDRNDFPTYAKLDAQFHQIIMDNGGNSILAHLGQTLRDRQTRFTSKLINGSFESARIFVEQHAVMAAALGAGDHEKYQAEIIDHLNRSREML